MCTYKSVCIAVYMVHDEYLIWYSNQDVVKQLSPSKVLKLTKYLVISK